MIFDIYLLFTLNVTEMTTYNNNFILFPVF